MNTSLLNPIRKAILPIMVFCLYSFSGLFAQNSFPDHLIPDWAPHISGSIEGLAERKEAKGSDFVFPGITLEGNKIPEIRMDRFQYRWDKNTGIMEVKNDGGSLERYSIAGRKFTGACSITVSKWGVTLEGQLKTDRVHLVGEKYTLLDNTLSGENITLEVKAPVKEKPDLFKGEELKIEFDLAKDQLAFEKKDKMHTSVTLPQFEYKTGINGGVIDLKGGQLRMAMAPGSFKGQGLTTSSREDQGELNFYAKTLTMDLEGKALEFGKVSSLYIADAKLYPEGEKVVIQPGGQIQPLKKCRIDANLETQYHRFQAENVEILGVHAYKGTGAYEYQFNSKNIQKVAVTELFVTSDTTTTAKISISEEDNFYLVPHVRFKGKMEVTAEKRTQRIQGEVKLEDLGRDFSDNWVKVDMRIDPKDFWIPIEQGGRPWGLASGLFYVRQYRVFYTNFLEPMRDKKDREVLTFEGELGVDPETGEYLLRPLDENGDGFEMRYAPEKQNIKVTGKMDFPQRFAPKATSLVVSGSWEENREATTLNTDLVLGVDLGCIPTKAWEKLADRFQLTMALQEDLDFEDQETRAAAPYSLLISNLNWTFDAKFKSLYSKGGEIGLIGINGETINKRLGSNSKVEYNFGKIQPNGIALSDTLSMYLEVDEFNWVYVKAHDEVVTVASSDLEGYSAVLKEKQKKNPKPGKYHYRLKDDMAKDAFLLRFVKRYIWRS